jgi:S1-C subfamily serine protease
MSEEYNDSSSEASAEESDKQPEVRPESGWVSNFKYLLPASFRSKPSFESDVDVSTFNPHSRDSDPIFLEASTFNDQREEECEVEDDGVIDVECYVEEVRDEKNATNAEIEDDGLDIEVELVEPISKPRNWFMSLFRSGAASEVHTAAFNATLNETVQHDQSTDLRIQDTTDNATNATPTKQEQRRKRHNKPIFHNLETNDIDSTMQSKQRKWSRRRKRAVMLVQGLKNACVLFVVTFLAGNLMNQFVDLDEDGSFEVHFGKALSSSPATSNVEKSASVERAGIIDRKRTATRPRLLASTEHKSLGLVSQAVQKVGPAVVRVETETDVLDSDTTNSNGDEDRGDIFDGIPEAPDKMIDFGQGSGIIIRINDEFHILTNAHVIDGASRINVLLTDGRRFKAELSGSDDIMDVAVLKILPEDFAQGAGDLVSDLPVADLGDSDRLEVGTFVSWAVYVSFTINCTAL